MAVSTPGATDFTSDTATAYKTQIDDNFAVAPRLNWAFTPHEQTTPNMTIRVQKGSIFNGVTLTEVAAQSSATIVAPTSDPRIDRVVIDRLTGAPSVVTGTEAASPVPPAIPLNKAPVAQIALTTSTTTIVNADITDERNFDILGSAALALGNTFIANQAIASTDAGSSVDPRFTLDRNSASPAIADGLGIIRFRGRDSAGGNVDYAAIYGAIIDPTNGSEDGRWTVQTAVAGTTADRFKFAQGLWSVGATGGDKGVDTINVSTYYKDGVVLSTGAQVRVKFDRAGTVNDSLNVDSVTDTGTGDWRVNITTDFASVDYVALAGYRDDAGINTDSDRMMLLDGQAVGSFDVRMIIPSAVPAAADPADAADDMHAIAFGDQ